MLNALLEHIGPDVSSGMRYLLTHDDAATERQDAKKLRGKIVAELDGTSLPGFLRWYDDRSGQSNRLLLVACPAIVGLFDAACNMRFAEWDEQKLVVTFADRITLRDRAFVELFGRARA